MTADFPDAPVHACPVAFPVDCHSSRQHRCCAGLVLAGAAASVSLLLRHWRAIEAWSSEPAAGSGDGDPAEPLLWQASLLPPYKSLGFEFR